MKLINDDCLNVMKELEPSSIDAIIVDPPYGINSKVRWELADADHNKSIKRKGILNDGEDNLPLLKESLDLAYRVLKDNSAMFFFTKWNKLGDHIQLIQDAGFKVKNNLIWLKNNHGLGDLKGSFAPKYECIIYATKGRVILNGKRDTDILEFARVHNPLHIHQKPIDLLEYLITKVTEPGDTILDFFMGTGSTGVACQNTNRHFIGCELDEETYQLALERIKNRD